MDLRDERVRVRSTTRSDVPELARIRSTPIVRARWRGADIAAEIHQDLDEGELVLLTIEDVAGRVVGMIQFGVSEDPDYRHASVDLFIDPDHHRRGYGSSAIRLVTDYLFDVVGHHRLVIDPAADNHPAIACYAKLGFREVGRLRRYERQVDGSWADGLLMEMLAEDRSPA